METLWVSMVLGPESVHNGYQPIETGLVELLGRECCDDYFNEVVGGDSIMGLGDIALARTNLDYSCPTSRQTKPDI